MLAEDGGQGGWAQVGYVRQSGHDLQHFVQHTKDGAGAKFTRFFGDPDSGDKNEYRVARYDTDHKLHELICDPDNGGNCNQVAHTDWDIRNQWSASESQFFGETFHPGSDVPGNTDERVNFSQVREKQQDNDWNNGDLDMGTSGVEAYRFEWVNQRSHFKIWTYPINR